MSNLRIKLKKDMYLDLEINDRITVIEGNSASGKTFFVDTIDMIVKLNLKDNVPSVITPDKFVVVKNEDSALRVKEAVNKIIILDRYDMYSKKTKKMIHKKMKEQNNTWIFISRFPDMPVYGSATIKHLKCREENGKKILYLARPY